MYSSVQYKKCQTVRSRIVIQSEMSVMSHDCTCVHTPLYLSPVAMRLWLCSISVHYRPARAKGGFRSPHSQPAGGDPIFLSSFPEENVLIKLSHFSVTRENSVRFPWSFLDMRRYRVMIKREKSLQKMPPCSWDEDWAMVCDGRICFVILTTLCWNFHETFSLSKHTFHKKVKSFHIIRFLK